MSSSQSSSLRNSTITVQLQRQFSRNEYLALARHGMNTEYCPRRFHAIIMRLRPTTTTMDGSTVTVLVFSSGRLVMTGIRRHISQQQTNDEITPQLHAVIGRICRRLDRSLAAGYRAGECGEPDGTTPAPPPLRPQSICVRNLVGSRRLATPLVLGPMREWMMAAYRSQLPLQQLQQPIQNGHVVVVHVKRCVLDQTTFPGLRCTLRVAATDDEEGNHPEHSSYELTSLVFGTGRFIVTGVRTLWQLEHGLDVMERLCSLFPSPRHTND